MNDDDLERALRALREEGDQPAPQARLTRQRILRDLRPAARRRRSMWLVPIAAVLAGSTVLAATGRLPEVLHAAARVLGIESRAPEGGTRSASPPKGAPPHEATPAKTPDARDEEPAAAAPAAEAPTPDPEPNPGRSRPVGVVAVRPDAGAPRRAVTPPAGTPPATVPPSPPPSEAAPPEDDQATLALYRRAHALHFVEQNPAAALSAWDAYLAADPHGPLAVDARYDRALCLVRLGRQKEARAALEPFAAGKFGGFRKAEAQALIDALPKAP